MDQTVRAKRLRLMSEKGIHPKAASWILDLEQGISEAIVSSITTLNQTPAFNGRRVQTAAGRDLVFRDGLWRLP